MRVSGQANVNAGRWLTNADCQTVLVIVPHSTAAYRLHDLLPVFDSDKRVQIMFAVPEQSCWSGVSELLSRRGGVVLPWHCVRDSAFDLAIAASYVGVHEVNAPVAIVPHGVGAIGSRRRNGSSYGAREGYHGLRRELLIRKGRLVPRVLFLSHVSELSVLARSCPEALAGAVVAGDPCYDRLVASLPSRNLFRDAFGVRSGQKLVVASSTWSTFSLFGSNLDIFDRLLADLPADEYRVAAVLHPNVWGAHGEIQVRMWLADAIRKGLILLPPENGWRAALVAADCVVGDHGSVTQYAAALQCPILMNDGSSDDIRPGSIAALLELNVPILNYSRSLREQIETSMKCWNGETGSLIARNITSRPGEATMIMRREFYRCLRLTEPEVRLTTAPVSPPVFAQMKVPYE